MILGVGVDILKLHRLPTAFLQDGDPFVLRTFTPEEIAQVKESGDSAAAYALRFSGKEAVFKAFKTTPDHVRGTDGEILIEGGVPRCALHGVLAERAAAKGVSRVHLSLSREGDTVVAFAVLEDEYKENM